MSRKADALAALNSEKERLQRIEFDVQRILEQRASWFNAERVNRIAFTDRLQGETVIIDTDSKTGTRVNIRHRFAESGRYYLEAGTLYGNHEQSKGVEGPAHWRRIPTEAF